MLSNTIHFSGCLYKAILCLSLFQIAISSQLYAQEDLLTLLEKDTVQKQQKEYTYATFKSTRVINGQSVETQKARVLQFLISHRFGRLNSGAYNFFGLDDATIRLGLEYGINDVLTIGIGRSSLEKTYDGFVKYKLLRQSTGAGAMPVSVVLFASTAINTLTFNEPERDNLFSSRLSYTYQVIIGRKFSEKLSLQLSPTVVHRNLVAGALDQNDVYAAGVAGRYKLTKRTSLNAEYFYILPGKTADDYYNSLSLGFDIETGGHVFQLHFTNSQGMIEKFFVPATNGNWLKGDIYFGFNISRVFSLKKEDRKP
jgi:predicted porin